MSDSTWTVGLQGGKMDESGTMAFPCSGWDASTYWSGRKVVSPNEPGYPFWHWAFRHRDQLPPDFSNTHAEGLERFYAAHSESPDFDLSVLAQPRNICYVHYGDRRGLNYLLPFFPTFGRKLFVDLSQAAEDPAEEAALRAIRALCSDSLEVFAYQQGICELAVRFYADDANEFAPRMLSAALAQMKPSRPAK